VKEKKKGRRKGEKAEKRKEIDRRLKGLKGRGKIMAPMADAKKIPNLAIHKNEGHKIRSMATGSHEGGVNRRSRNAPQV